jgi:transcriptional regulator with XRE-family HTH domain
VLPTELRMKLGNDGPFLTANERVIATVNALMEWRRMTQAELAEKLGQSQPWLSKRLTGRTPFQIEDLDLIGAFFGLSPAELLQDGHGNLDRRSSGERRSGTDRRRRARPPFLPKGRPLPNPEDEGVA